MGRRSIVGEMTRSPRSFGVLVLAGLILFAPRSWGDSREATPPPQNHSSVIGEVLAPSIDAGEVRTRDSVKTPRDSKDQAIATDLLPAFLLLAAMGLLALRSQQPQSRPRAYRRLIPRAPPLVSVN
jgi:hypothetical protein